VKRFVRAHRGQHPTELGGEDVGRFLSTLAEHDRVSAATQNQAASALLFLYRAVLGRDVKRWKHVVRGRTF
jgi:hypothetical protein